MQDPIVAEPVLRTAYPQIKGFVADRQGCYAVDVDDPHYGSAFLYYLFFAEHPSAGRVLGFDLSDEARFYNAYYWFQRFVSLHKGKHGPNAGLDQQAFKMLEYSPVDIDFELIDMLDLRSRSN